MPPPPGPGPGRERRRRAGGGGDLSLYISNDGLEDLLNTARTFEDRTINGLNDGYTIEQAGRLCALLIAKRRGRGRAPAANRDRPLSPPDPPGLPPMHQRRQDHPAGARRKSPHAALPRGVTPSRSRPLPSRRPRPLASPPLGDLGRDAAGFPPAVVLVYHEGPPG